MLELRCGFFEERAFDLIDVCEDHLKLMATKFIEKTVTKHTCCLWPTHGNTLRDSRLTKDVKTEVVSLELSRKIKKHLDLLVPVDGVLCVKHHEEVMEKLPSAPPPPPQQDLMDTTDSPSASSGNVLSQGSVYKPTSQDMREWNEELKGARLEILQTLLKKNFIEEEVKYIAETPFNELERGSQWKMMKNLGLSFFAVMKTLSMSGDYVQLWSAAKTSTVFQSQFTPSSSPPAYLDSLLGEIIHSHNFATSRQERRQILSILPNTYSYAFLAKFNKIKEATSADESENTLQSGPKSIFWDPPLTAYKYRIAKLHAMENARGFSPVIFEPKHTWHISDEQFEAIFGKHKIQKMLQIHF